MQLMIAIGVLLVLTGFAYRVGVGRSMALATGNIRVLHSLPSYYGAYLALWIALPAFSAMALWLAAEPLVVSALVFNHLPADVQALAPERLSLVRSTIANLAQGEITGIAIEPYMRVAAEQHNSLTALADKLMLVVVFAGGAIGFVVGRMRIAPRMRARNAVENVVRIVLIICSMIAIVTTIGIVLSMLFQTLAFFSTVSPIDFFFGTVWDPRFTSSGRDGGASGQFGLLPLLWGTVFISFISMCVAVPVGLLSAIYLSEYAPRKFRAVAKPLLEILAGIPTVVYGFFALTVLGPFLRDIGAMVDLEIQATSALTAGVVMGIMIIPFVSSLSDDIISAVPNALREGSYGLGATQSETIKRVIFPAALPGIVGAILLAVSRALGETMIVVMAAGLAATLTANPFEPVTTVTVKIVSQLTGDLQFNSPQTLVAFALGLTLFVMTLCLNVLALHIVRKYREQYE